MNHHEESIIEKTKTVNKFLGEQVFRLLKFFSGWKISHLCTGERLDQNCLQFPDQFETTSKIMPPKHTAREKKLFKELQWVRDALMGRNLEPQELQAGIQCIKKRHIILIKKNLDGTFYPIEARQKGTCSYNKRMLAKIVIAVKQGIKDGYAPFALTLTCDQKLYGGNRAIAWNKYHKDHQIVLKELKRKFKARYVWVNESTKEGWPHDHVILFIPKKYVPYYDQLRPRAKIRFGKLFECIKKYTPSPVFHLEAMKGKSVVWYLAKYISKMSSSSIFNLTKKKEGLDDKETKMLQQLVYQVACECRSYHCSRDLLKEWVDNPEEKQLQQCDDMHEEHKDLINIPEEMSFIEAYYTLPQPAVKKLAAKLRRELDYICINFPCLQNEPFVLRSANAFYKGFEGKPPEFDEMSQDYLKDQFEKGILKDCQGCMYGHIRKLVRTGFDPLLSQPLLIERGKKISYFTFDVLHDDTTFLLRLLWLYCCMNVTISVYKKNWREFFHNETLQEWVVGYMEDSWKIMVPRLIDYWKNYKSNSNTPQAR